MPDWLTRGAALSRKILSDPKCVQNFTRLMEPIIKNQFQAWAKSEEIIPLFDSISSLTATAMLHMFLGPDFAERHAKELVPMIKEYEMALQKPEVKLFPRWASRSGRLLMAVERLFNTLVTNETERRVQSLDECKDNLDYFQQVLNVVGNTYSKGVI